MVWNRVNSRLTPMSVYYFLFFLTIGVFAPYFNLFLQAKGFNSQEIGFVLALIPAVGLLVQPLWGLFSDRYQRPKSLLFAGISFSGISVLLLYRLDGVYWIVPLTISYALFQTGLIPLTDSLTVQAVGVKRYGQVRLFGSVGYAVAVNAAGLLYQRLGAGMLPLLYTFAALAAIVGLRFYPVVMSAPKLGVKHWTRLHTVLRNRKFIKVLGIMLLVGMTQWMNSNFFSLYVDDLEHSIEWLGLIYALGALSELPFLFFSGYLIKRLGPLPVLVAAASVFAFRWLVLAMTPPLIIIGLLQLLHGASFGLSLTAGIALVAQLSSEENRHTAQTVYSAVMTGVAAVLGSAVGGVVFYKLGPALFYGTASFVCFLSVMGLLFLLKGPRCVQI